MTRKQKSDFNGFDFDEQTTAKRMKYLVVTDGDLDLNGAYAFKNKRDLVKYLRTLPVRDVQAVFRVTYLQSMLTK